MASIKETAKVVSTLVPKVMTGVKCSLMFSEEVTTQQMITILVLNEIGRAKISVLSKRMGVSAPTITGLIDRLQRGGYVGRIRDVGDRRVVFVKLTKKGHKFVATLKRTIQERWTKILVYLTGQERLTYIKILKKIIKALENENPVQHS